MNAASSLSVLIVEDNPVDAAALRRLLAKRTDIDIHVHIAHELAAARQLLIEGDKVECILLDLALPDSDGLDTLRAVLDVTTDLPIVVLTATDDMSTALAAVHAGAQDYLPKGDLDDEMVIRSIRYAVARHESAVALARAHEQNKILDDRARIASELHQTIIGNLFLIGLSMQSLGSQLEANMAPRIIELVDQLDHTIQQIRAIVFDATPAQEPAIVN
jgi:DNA-binding NarL/FixJ family response regulator